MGNLYVGESDGGRIIRFGSGLTQITTASTESVLGSWQTWDMVPMGPAGDCIFRNIIVTIAYSNGYAITVTPSVDGVALSPQSFTGSGSGTKDCQAFVATRGARLSVTVEMDSRTGDVELVDVQASFKAIRATP